MTALTSISSRPDGVFGTRGFKRTDQEPVVIDGLLFATLEVGFAWPDPEGAIAHAKTQIDRNCKAHHKGVNHVAL